MEATIKIFICPFDYWSVVFGVVSLILWISFSVGIAIFFRGSDMVLY